MKRFDTNTSKSINIISKDKVVFKKCKLNQFVDHRLEIVKRQEIDMKEAVCQLGDGRLIFSTHTLRSCMTIGLECPQMPKSISPEGVVNSLTAEH